MRKAHDIPPLVKAANLASWFSPWTVNREQWSSMTRPEVSGRAVDTLLFSRIVVSPVLGVQSAGYAWGFRMRSRYIGVIADALGILQHGCRGHLYMTQMIGRRTSLLDQGRLVDLAHGFESLHHRLPWPVHRRSGGLLSHRSEGSTIQALMDLALPRFADSGDRPVRPDRSWIVTTDSPASPDPGCLTGLITSPSPCMNLDVLSSDESDEAAGPGDVSSAPICVSDDCGTPVSPEEVLSDVDLPITMFARDQRQVIQIRDVPQEVQIVDLTPVAQFSDTRRAVWGAKHLMDIPCGNLRRYGLAIYLWGHQLDTGGPG